MNNSEKSKELEGWHVVYDLSMDEETVALIQRATTTTKNFGVVPEVALFGTREWWNAVDVGDIQKHTVMGIIGRVFTGVNRDWPEFEVIGEEGTTQWTQLGDSQHYQVGAEVRVEYIFQRLRNPAMAGVKQKQVLRVLIRTPGGSRGTSRLEGP